MYNLSQIVSRISEICRKKDISINQMLIEANLSTSLIDNMKRGRSPSIDRIYQLAEYLDCSVDYLLGRSSEISLNASSNNTLENKIPTDNELQQQIKDNMQKLNSQGLMRLADYSNDLVSSGNYKKKIPSLKIARTAPGNPYVQPYMEDEEDLSKYPETDMDL